MEMNEQGKDKETDKRGVGGKMYTEFHLKWCTPIKLVYRICLLTD